MLSCFNLRLLQAILDQAQAELVEANESWNRSKAECKELRAKVAQLVRPSMHKSNYDFLCAFSIIKTGGLSIGFSEPRSARTLRICPSHSVHECCCRYSRGHGIPSFGIEQPC